MNAGKEIVIQNAKYFYVELFECQFDDRTLTTTLLS